jgi:hypothetical protein
MDMIYRFVMFIYWSFTGLVKRAQLFKVDKMDKMDIKYINIFLSILVLGGIGV